MIYVIVDLGHPGKIERLQQLHDRKYDEGENPPLLIVIDAKEQISASRAWNIIEKKKVLGLNKRGESSSLALMGPGMPIVSNNNVTNPLSVAVYEHSGS